MTPNSRNDSKKQSHNDISRPQPTTQIIIKHKVINSAWILQCMQHLYINILREN